MILPSLCLGQIYDKSPKYLHIVDGLILKSPKTFVEMLNSFSHKEISKADTLIYEDAVIKYGSVMQKWDGAIELTLRLPICYNDILLDDSSKIQKLSSLDDNDITRIEFLNRRKSKRLLGKDMPIGCIRLLTKH